MNRSARGWSVKQFERSNGLDTALYKIIPLPCYQVDVLWNPEGGLRDNIHNRMSLILLYITAYLYLVTRSTYCGTMTEDYVMPDSLIMIGQVCVAIYPDDNNWHRVTITGIHSLDFVEVRTFKDNISVLKSEYPTSVNFLIFCFKSLFCYRQKLSLSVYLHLLILRRVNHGSSTWKWHTVLQKYIFKSCSFCFLPCVIQSVIVQGCLVAALHVWNFPKLNIIFSAACFEAIVQILSEMFFSEGVTTLFDGFIYANVWFFMGLYMRMYDFLWA